MLNVICGVGLVKAPIKACSFKYSAHINLHIQAFHPHHPKDSLLYITAQGGLKKGMYIALRQPCGGGGDCLNPVEHVSCQRESTPKGDQNLQFAPLIKQYDKHPCSFHMRVPQPHPPWRDRNECSRMGCGLVMGVG